MSPYTSIMNREVNRRNFIRSAVAVGAVAMLDQPTIASLTSPSVSAAEKKRYFAPIKVDRSRRIRTVVGLRPYRPQGFVVEASKFGDKFLVHNYGHGGGGITLSWGTSSLAIDLARDFNLPTSSRQFAVLGCGVIGLSTARFIHRLLRGAGGSVTIYAKDLPPETTSNVAGGFWLPTSVYNEQKISTAFSNQFHAACLISNRAFQTLVGPDYGVRWIDAFELLSSQADLEREPAGGAHLYPQIKRLKDGKKHFGVEHVREYSTMLIEPHTYLNALLRDFQIAGGKVVIKEFKSREELAGLPEEVIFNCTGLGARALFDDRHLKPVRGQLEVLLPQPEIDYCYLGGEEYMFPRRDGIVLGGTWDHDRWDLEPDAEQSERILELHAELMKHMKP
jgi:glycine/D-amino acid oxidase-like deaminating enzyme